MHHPDFPAINIPPQLFAYGFTTRHAYRNDACVRLTRGALSLWVDHEDPDQRDGEGARFTIHPHDEEFQCADIWHEFDDLPSLLAHLESLN
jgi:hypothetical protein